MPCMSSTTATEAKYEIVTDKGNFYFEGKDALDAILRAQLAYPDLTITSVRYYDGTPPTVEHTLTLTITVKATGTANQVNDLNEFAGIVAQSACERLEDSTRGNADGVTSASWEVH